MAARTQLTEGSRIYNVTATLKDGSSKTKTAKGWKAAQALAAAYDEQANVVSWYADLRQDITERLALALTSE